MEYHSKLTPLERTFLSFDSIQTPQTIGCALILDREPNLNQLQAKLLSTVSAFPRLSEILRGNHWHQATTTPEIEKREFPDLCISEAIGEMVSSQLDLNTSPWKVSLIVDKQKKYALIVTWHHAYCDGMGGIPFVASLTDMKIDLNRHPKISKIVNQKLFTLQSLKALLSLATSKRRSSNLLVRKSFEQKVVLSTRIPSAYINATKKLYGLTPYEVFLGLLAISFNNLFTKKSQIEIIVPVSTRRHLSQDPLRNLITASSLTLECNETFDESAKKIKIQMKNVKNPANLAKYQIGVDLFGRLPIPIQKLFWRKALNDQLAICTGLGSIKVPLSVAGSNVTEILSTPAPIFSQSVGFSWLEYQDNFILTAVAVKSKIEEIKILIKTMEEYVRS